MFKRLIPVRAGRRGGTALHTGPVHLYIRFPIQATGSARRGLGGTVVGINEVATRTRGWTPRRHARGEPRIRMEVRHVGESLRFVDMVPPIFSRAFPRPLEVQLSRT